MSLQDQIARKKSERWTRASSANYDGDDWSDEDRDGDIDHPINVPQLPKLPSTDLSKYEQQESLNDENLERPDGSQNLETLVANKGDILENLYENNDDQSVKEEEAKYLDNYSDNDGGEDEDDEYKPKYTRSQRFKPVDHGSVETKASVPNIPNIDANTAKSIVESVITESSNPKTVSSPVPSEDRILQEGFQFHEEPAFNSDEEFDDQEYQNHPQHELQYEQELIHTSNPSTRLDADSNELINHVPTPIHSNLDKAPQNNDLVHQLVSKVENYQPYSKESPTNEDISEQPLFSPTDQETENSQIIPPINPQQEIENSNDTINNSNGNVSHYEYDNRNQNNLDEADVDADDEFSPKKNRFQSFVTPESADLINSNHNVHGLTIDAKKANDNQHPEFNPSPSSSPNNGSHRLSFVSDTDTLHLQVEESEHEREEGPHNHPQHLDDSSIKEITQQEFEHGVNLNQGFSEHAYLSSIINTPDLNDHRFDNNGNDDEQSKIIESQEPLLLEEDVDTKENIPTSPETSNEINGSAPKSARDSKFYSSLQDYYDDYTEEHISDEKDHSNDHRLNTFSSINTFHSNNSSGSLSTGSFPIKSENAYRSSISERTTSFTNQSIAEVPSGYYDNFDGYQNEEDGEDEDDDRKDDSNADDSKHEQSSLNPAMSINFGQWRPNTDSFRDQFIKDTTPPIPQIDRYSRNSRGEIVETSTLDSKDLSFNKHDNESEQLTLGETIGTKQSTLTDNQSTLTDNQSTINNGSNDENIYPKKDGETYRTESGTSLPLHIPLAKEIPSGKTNFFQEHNNVIASPQTTPKKNLQKPTNYNFKNIGNLQTTEKRIESYRNARTEEANIESNLDEWIQFSLEKIEVIPYQSNVTQHVKQAYAEASTSAKKHRPANMGSFLGKSRVLHDTSSTAQSFAKGIFSRGKKIMKN
ncbi:hypothetical protein WICMUC_002007 [Wickerhamomyces mucosus]|uniref:Protein FYV8 n=1 Tax=Wickerhamomyces mucosus TaxID=1378264 RepID=A0A9P8PQI5_9ASCO|nr:hypothetical protein WICMUC_002007 [Wickerhamomyces mucosus]